MIQIENTYFELGKSCSKNCLIICDRGVMDASACKLSHSFTTISIPPLGSDQIMVNWPTFLFWISQIS